jgi:Rha family phage regulatory protein
MENRITTISIMKVDDRVMVSSKEVADKFGKDHFHVLRDIKELQVPNDFRLSNFGSMLEPDSQGIERPIINMTRDGFTILAFGFTGKKALQWKLGFLEAFNKMEHAIIEQLPALKAQNEELRKENFQMTQRILALPAEKKPHGNKNTVLIPVQVNTLFGSEIEYRRVQKELPQFSDMTYKEGELKRLSNIMYGMVKKIGKLSNDLSKLRRM